METTEALTAAIAELRKIRREHEEEISKIDSATGFLEKRVTDIGGKKAPSTISSGIGQAPLTTERVGSARDVCIEILRERGPLSNRDLFDAARARGLQVKSPSSLYGSLAREKGRIFDKKSGKWLLIGR